MQKKTNSAAEKIQPLRIMKENLRLFDFCSSKNGQPFRWRSGKGFHLRFAKEKQPHI